MHLERVTCEPPGSCRPVALLFVHGAWHGAWCWREHFLPYFARHGYRSHAFDLRGHGGSDGGERLRRTGIAHYVADVDRVVRELDAPPVIIGHSMGGFVVQKYLEAHRAPAAVLLASVPPSGGMRAVMRLLRRHPLAVLKANATMTLYHVISKPHLAREAFFSHDMADKKLQAYSSMLQNESYRAFLNMLAFGLPRPQRVRTPMLVLGAERDTFFTRKEVEDTGRAYGTTATFFRMAHDMMLEDGWRDVADHIMDWLDTTLPN